MLKVCTPESVHSTATNVAEFGNVVDEGAKEADAFVGKQVNVFGNTLVGVVRFARQAQAVVFVTFEPVCLELLGQVGAPAEDEAFLQPVAANDAADDHRHVAEVSTMSAGMDAPSNAASAS